MKIIYEPKGRAREYAALAANLYTGCTHGCKYCYAPKSLFVDRVKFHSEAKFRYGDIERCLNDWENDCMDYQDKGLTEPVLMSFASDPYQPAEMELKLTRRALDYAAHYHVPIHILTKGGMRAARDFELLKATGDQAAFAVTLTYGTLRDDEKYEPLAANHLDRLKALKVAHDMGINTWVSFEPAISECAIVNFIRTSSDYVDLYKIGKISGDKSISQITGWKGFGLRTVELLERLGKKYIIKNDLKKEMEK